MVWYSHLFQNLPQFIVIHTVKGFGNSILALIGKKKKVFADVIKDLDREVILDYLSGPSTLMS